MDVRARDAELVERVKAGERDCFDMFVYLYERPLYNFVLGHGLSQDSAGDVTQETFLKAYRSIAAFDARRAAFKTWLYTIAVNLCRDFGRRQSARQRQVEELAREHSEQPTATDEHGRFEDRDRIERLLSTLDDDSASIIRMKFLQDLSYESICAITGMPKPTVRSKIQRGMKRLLAVCTEKAGDAP